MIAGGSELKQYADDAKLKGNLTTVKLKKNQEIEVSIPCNGAVLLVN